MKSGLLILVCSSAFAGEIPASWISAIHDGASAVTGIDVERFRASGSPGAALVDIPFDAHRAIRYVMRIGTNLYLLKVAGDPFALAPRGRRFVEEGREVAEVGDGQFLIRASRDTAILGSLHDAHWAAELMQCCPKHNLEIATLVASFDAWIYQPREAEIPGADLLFEASRFAPPIHNLRAGVRFGNSVQIRVEVQTDNALQASALAIAAKLTPTIIRNAGRIEADFAASIEKFSATARDNAVIAEMAVGASALRLLE
jgi:hypothetical protein